MRQLLLKIDDDKTLLVETDFDNRFLEEAASQADMDLFDPMKGVNELVKMGYVKLVGNGPEVLDLFF